MTLYIHFPSTVPSHFLHLVSKDLFYGILDELIEKNKGKATKKSAKREAMNRQMEEYAKKKTAGIKSASAYQNTAASSSKEEEVQTHVNKDFESGSIAGYAHMLSGKKDKK